MKRQFLTLRIVRKITFFLFVFINMPVFSYLPTVDEIEADKIIAQLSSEMHQRYGLFCIGTGGNLNDGVKKLSVSFISYKKASIEEAREIEVNATERFLYLINNNEKIRPYLFEYPFTMERTDVSLGFSKADGGYYLDGSVVYVFIAKGKIFYRKAELVKQKPIPFMRDGKPDFSYMNGQEERMEETLVPLKEESYQEALKIVKENSSLSKEP